MATFRRRNGKWQVQIRRTGCSPVSKSFVFKSDAFAWARQAEADFDRLAVPESRKLLTTLNFKDLLQRYLDTVVPTKRGKRNETYTIQAIMRSELGSLKLFQITPQTMEGYRDKRLLENGPATVRRELSVLSHLYETARRTWLIPITVNPITVIRKPVLPLARKRRLRGDEYDRLMNVCAKLINQNMAKLIEFTIETGMRRGEITTLQWQNVDLYKNTVFLPMTKNGLSRTVPLTPKAYDILVSLSPKEAGSVFNLTNVAVRQTWERLTARAEIEDLHFHDLRHEAISRFFELGL